MDDIVAIRVRLTNGEDRFFLTWGRLFDRVEGRELCKRVWDHLGQFSLGGEPESIELCDSLQVACGERYFFECFFELCRKGIPFGPEYPAWAETMRATIEQGKEILYLGAPHDSV